MTSVDEISVQIAAINRASAELHKVARDISALDRAAGNTGGLTRFNQQTGITNRGLTQLAGGFIAAQVGIHTLETAFRSTIGAAIGFEDSFAGIRKTVDGTEADFKALEKANRDMAKSLPVSVNEINRIGETAGALGITGVKDIESFERTIATLAITTNITADEAAAAFGKIRTALNIPVSDLDNLASAIVDLGNKGASTEREIVEVFGRIAGAGNLLGLLPGQIAGIASAFAGLPLEAEATGTALQRVFLEMSKASIQGGESLEVFAATAGKTAQSFAELVRVDPAEAFVSFLKGLSLAGDDTLRVLEALGLEDARLTRTLLTGASAVDEITRQTRLGTTAFNENSAATVELNKRLETTSSQYQLLKNRLNDIGITVGNAVLPTLNSLIRALSELTDIAVSTRETLRGMNPMLFDLALALGSPITAVNALNKNWQAAWNAMAGVMEPVVQRVVNVGTAIFNVLGGIGVALGGLVGGWSNAWGRVVSIINSAGSAIETVLQGIVNAIAEVAGAVDSLTTGLRGVVSAGKGVLDKVGLGRLADVVPNVPRLGIAAPDINIPRAGSSTSGTRSGSGFGRDRSLDDRFRSLHTSTSAAGIDIGNLSSVLDSALAPAASKAGGAAEQAVEKIDPLADGVIDFWEAAQLGLTAAQAGSLELARVRDLEALAAANAQFELTKLSDVLGQQGITSEAFQFALALEAIETELKDSGRSITEFLRDVSQSAADALRSAFGDLFGKPTREAARINVQIAELELERARKRATGASEKELKSLDNRIDSLRRLRDVSDKQADLLQAQNVLADQTLLTEQQRKFAATLYTIALNTETTTLQGLTVLANLEALARQGLIDAMNEAARATRAAAGLDAFNPAEKSFINAVARGKGETEPFPGFKQGLANVPRDNFPALLHKGERVLTASQNRQFAGGGFSPHIEIHIIAEGDMRGQMEELGRMVEERAARALQESYARGSFVTSGAFAPS